MKRLFALALFGLCAASAATDSYSVLIYWARDAVAGLPGDLPEVCQEKALMEAKAGGSSYKRSSIISYAFTGGLPIKRLEPSLDRTAADYGASPMNSWQRDREGSRRSYRSKLTPGYEYEFLLYDDSGRYAAGKSTTTCVNIYLRR